MENKYIERIKELYSLKLQEIESKANYNLGVNTRLSTLDILDLMHTIAKETEEKKLKNFTLLVSEKYIICVNMNILKNK